MLKVVEATIDEKGTVTLLEPLQLPKPARAFVVLFSEEIFVTATALLSEAALAEHWLRPEEDIAWAHLQPDESS